MKKEKPDVFLSAGDVYDKESTPEEPLVAQDDATSETETETDEEEDSEGGVLPVPSPEPA